MTRTKSRAKPKAKGRPASTAKIKTRLWDPAEHLTSDADVAAYLTAALEDGDPKLVAAAFGDVARARGMTKLANDAGLAREALYRALSADGNPSFAGILRVAKALGVRFVAEPAERDSAA